MSRNYSGRCQHHAGISVRGGAPACLEGAQSPGKPPGGWSWACGPRRQPLPPSNAVPRSVPGVPAARHGRTQPAPSQHPPSAARSPRLVCREVGFGVKGANGAQVSGGSSRPLSPRAGARASGGNRGKSQVTAPRAVTDAALCPIYSRRSTGLMRAKGETLAQGASY